MGILDVIIAQKHEDVAAAKRKLPLIDVKHRVADQAPVPAGLSFSEALQKDGLSLIAEIKRKSPSGGELRPDLNPMDIARIYEDNGARAISVLTDFIFFGGSLDTLSDVKTVTRLPVLRKEFIIDPYQIWESGLYRADAVLFIVRILSKNQLEDFIGLSNELHLACLVEVHNEDEMGIALEAGAIIIGINNRDLDTLAISLDTSLRLRQLIPSDRIAVSESGIKTRRDVCLLEEAGFNGLLIGETLMRHDHPGHKIKELLGEDEQGRQK